VGAAPSITLGSINLGSIALARSPSGPAFPPRPPVPAAGLSRAVCGRMPPRFARPRATTFRVGATPHRCHHMVMGGSFA